MKEEGGKGREKKKGDPYRPCRALVPANSTGEKEGGGGKGRDLIYRDDCVVPRGAIHTRPGGGEGKGKT